MMAMKKLEARILRLIQELFQKHPGMNDYSVLERDVQEGYAEKVTLQLSLKNEQLLVSWRRRRTSIWQKEWLRNHNCAL